MAEESEKKPPQSVDRTGEFFNVGAPLHAVRPGYVCRAADDLLYNTIVAGNYAHVIAPDRSGKTSLIASISARLRNNGFKVAILDLEQIGERDGGSDGAPWYYSIAYRILRQLRLKTDLQTWWQDHAILSNRQRLVEFYVQVVLKNIPDRIVIFVDEVQCVADLPFAEDLLASIRAANNARMSEPEFNRLGFVIVGDCDPQSLVSDAQVSPFSISTEIQLQDFSREDLSIFAAELNLPAADAEKALDRVFYWTSGQPYLSQKLARAIAREQFSADIEDNIDRLALQQLAGRAALESEPHLNQLQRVMVRDRKNFDKLLTLYGRVRKGISIELDKELPIHRLLLANGLIEADKHGKLAVRNRIYEAVFSARWANENLRWNWRGPALMAAVFLLLTAIPFAYTQLLPKPYLRVMSTQDYDLQTVSNAYTSLRSFPGHVAAADRMYRFVLESRALQAVDAVEIRELARFAMQIPDGFVLADDMTAGFWDRQTVSLMRTEQRDAALLTSLEALVVTTQERRRRAASLIGDDYAQLIATVPAPQADGMVFNSDNMQISWHSGAEIIQWSAVGDRMQSREPWTISALEVSPLVRRVIVDRDDVATRIGLTVNVSHSRLDDIYLKLIAPSGRTADLSFSTESSAANEEIRIPADQLAPLLGEALSGTWSLSLRDEVLGVSGHLVGWSLNLNAQVVVEGFERGLDIPDPLERASENLWFSPDGRYAIARALRSDSARLWDLSYAQAARTMAVPASEQVIGVSANAEMLVTMEQNLIHLWRTSDGTRSVSLEVGGAVTNPVLSADGKHLLVSYRQEPDTLFEVWSLETGEKIAEMSIAGSPALMSIDANAVHLAIADFDRAVRIWNIRDGELKAQIDLKSQPRDIRLSAKGDSLGVLLNQQGVSLWRTDQPAVPVMRESGSGEWHMAFSQSGARFIAGNQREGMQVYRSSNGAPSGPLLDPGLRFGVATIFAFSNDESVVVTAGLGDKARFWSMPDFAGETVPVASTGPNSHTEEMIESVAIVNAISPGGERLAFGDRAGHVHINQTEAAVGRAATDPEDISFVGHSDAVLSVIFSQDGALVASAGADGSIRIWDAHSGLPRPFYGRAKITTIDRIVFSPNAKQLAVLGGQHVWLMDTETGAELASIELGEPHADLAFAADNRLFLGAESGALRNLYADRSGNWNLRLLWQGQRAIRRLQIAPNRQLIALVDAQHRVRLLDLRDGSVSSAALQLPDAVSDLFFSPNESRLLFKTGRWLHRALVTPTGLIWVDTIRAPKAVNHARIVFDGRRIAATPADARSRFGSGDGVLVLNNDTGMTELAELSFSYTEGPALFGSRSSLVGEWTERLQGPAASGFVREGF